MSNPQTNLTAKLDELQAQLLAQHDELMALLGTRLLGIIDMTNRVERQLEGTATNSGVFQQLITLQSLIGTLTDKANDIDGQLATANTNLVNINDDYNANNPLIVSRLFDIYQELQAIFTPTNATNITVGEILLKLEDCCGDAPPVYNEPGDCASKLSLIYGGGTNGNLRQLSDGSFVTPVRRWIGHGDNGVPDFQGQNDTYFVSSALNIWYLPQHDIDYVFISNIGEFDMQVYYVDITGALGDITIPGGTICQSVPDGWQAFAMSYPAGVSGYEAYIGVVARP